MLRDNNVSFFRRVHVPGIGGDHRLQTGYQSLLRTVYGLLVFPREATPKLEAGQFWAALSPLGLFRIDSAEEGHGPAGYFWDSSGAGERTYFQFDPEKYRYLWFNKMRAFGLDGPKEVRVGDVWLLEHDEVSTRPRNEPRLIFIGPDTEGTSIHVLANWSVPKHHKVILAHLYQPGPGRSPPSLKSVYQHLREPSL